MGETEVPQPPSPLPRGRHSLAPELVRDSQRRRMLDAAAEALAEEGAWALTVAQITERAGVSRATFYAHFADKLDCLIQAHADALGALIAEIEAACASSPNWPLNLIAAVTTCLDFAEANPAQAALLTIDAAAVEPRLAQRILIAQGRLAELLHAAASEGGETDLPELTARALIGGASSAIAAALRPDPLYPLEQLRLQLPEVLLSPYLGPDLASQAVSGVA